MKITLPNITPGPREITDAYEALFYNDNRVETVYEVGNRTAGSTPAYTTSEEEAKAIAALPECLAAMAKTLEASALKYPSGAFNTPELYRTLPLLKSALLKAGATITE